MIPPRGARWSGCWRVKRGSILDPDPQPLDRQNQQDDQDEGERDLEYAPRPTHVPPVAAHHEKNHQHPQGDRHSQSDDAEDQHGR